MISEIINLIGMAVGLLFTMCRDNGARWFGLGLLIFSGFGVIMCLVNDIIQLIS